jgi:hypothetical protein
MSFIELFQLTGLMTGGILAVVVLIGLFRNL